MCDLSFFFSENVGVLFACSCVCCRVPSYVLATCGVSVPRPRLPGPVKKATPHEKKSSTPPSIAIQKGPKNIRPKKKRHTPESGPSKKAPPGAEKEQHPAQHRAPKSFRKYGPKNKAHLTAGTVQKSLPPPLPGQEKSSLPPSSATRKARAPKKTHPGKDIPHCRDLPRRSPPGQNKSSTPPSTARHRAPKENLLKKKPHLTAGALPKRPPLPLHSLPPPSPGQEQWRTPPRTTHQIWPRNTLPPPHQKKSTPHCRDLPKKTLHVRKGAARRPAPHPKTALHKKYLTADVTVCLKAIPRRHPDCI